MAMRKQKIDQQSILKSSSSGVRKSSITTPTSKERMQSSFQKQNDDPLHSLSG